MGVFKKIGRALGIKKKGTTGRNGGFSSMVESLVNDPKAKNALQEGEARIAPKKMAYGGKVKKKGVRRADGCAVRGKTKGRMV